MYDIHNYLRLFAFLWNRYKMVFVVPAYFFAFIAFEYRALIFFAPFIVAAAAAYAIDKGRDEQGKDNFRGDWLFFRYGQEIDKSFFGLPVKSSWSSADVASFASSLRESLAERIQGRLPADSVQVLGNLAIRDKETSETKTFLRMKARSRFGSTLTHFIHYASFGETITAHHFMYLRGPYSDWGVVKFVLASPWTIWFWGIPWLLNRYSVLASISQFRASSFDGIDIQTLYSLVNQVLLEEVEALLDEAGLLTEELKQTLHYHIKTTQNISITGSSNVSLGNVSQSQGVLRTRSA